MDKTVCDTLLTNYNFHKIFFLILPLFSFEGEVARAEVSETEVHDLTFTTIKGFI